MPAWARPARRHHHQGAGRLRPLARRRREMNVPGSIPRCRKITAPGDAGSRAAGRAAEAERLPPATTARSTRRAQGIYPQSVKRHLPHGSNGSCWSSRSASTTCCRSCAGIAARTRRPGRADRFPGPALLFLLHRDLAAGSLLPHRPADPRRDGAVPDERGRRPRLVRLSLPADGVDRPVLCGRALGRGRPARAHAARRRPWTAETIAREGRQACRSG